MIFILVYLPSMVDFSNYYNNALSSYLYELEFEFEFKFSECFIAVIAYLFMMLCYPVRMNQLG